MMMPMSANPSDSPLPPQPHVAPWRPGTEPDLEPTPERGPGRTTPWWLWVITALLLITVVGLQRPETADPKKEAEAIKGVGRITPPRMSELTVFAKLVLWAKRDSAELAEAFMPFVDTTGGWASGPGAFGAAPDPTHPPEAQTRLHSIITFAEGRDLTDATKATIGKRLDDVNAQLAPDSPMVEDIATLRRVYGAPGLPEDAPTVNSDAAKAGLIERHGFFGRLALEHGDKQSKTREAAANDGLALMLIFTLAGLGVTVAALVGVVLLIFAAASFKQLFTFRGFTRPAAPSEWPNDPVHGEHRRIPLATPGSVWLETFTIFVAGFLALKLLGEGMHLLGGKGAMWPVWFSLIGQWLLMGAIVWPVARGMSWQRWKNEIGWHSGRGVFKEIGVGLGAYLAGIPLYIAWAICVVVVWFAVRFLMGDKGAPTAGNKLTDIVEGGSPLMLACVFLLATVWAPITEESIFRGALYRHLRRRLPLILAALVSASLFAVLHGYLIAQLFMVGSLGVWFALMREWRGSLIPSVTAHAVHNAAVLSLLLLIAHFAGV